MIEQIAMAAPSQRRNRTTTQVQGGADEENEMNSKMTVLSLTVLMALLVGNPALAQTDYVLQNYEQGGTGYIPPYGDSTYSCLVHMPSNAIGIMYWNVPPVVRPGMSVRVTVKWLVWTNHIPVTYVNYFGDWQPDVELAQGSLYGGIPNPGDVYVDAFSFTAPSSPGWYRIRLMWYLAYDPIPSFYGASDRLPHGFSEVVFHVGYPLGGAEDNRGSQPVRSQSGPTNTPSSAQRAGRRQDHRQHRGGRQDSPGRQAKRR
jgi:hypothetical protein